MATRSDSIRRRMVQQQVRAWDVLDQTVLDTMARMPREQFLPESERGIAFADAPLPLPGGRQTLTPRVEGRLLQTLQLTPHERVLEIGTGSGYVTACLAQLAREVISIDASRELTDRARSTIEALGIRNCSISVADPAQYQPDGEFDAIAVTGSIPVYDERFQRWLRIGGRLFIVVGKAPAMDARLVRRMGADEYSTESLFETVVPPLAGFAPGPEFDF